MEIITGIERRRRWRDEDKLRIVAEAEAPGAVFAEVARRYDISRGQLWNWRRLVRAGELSLVSAPAQFLPLRIQRHPHTVVPDDLHQRARPATEYEQIPAVWIPLQPLLDQ